MATRSALAATALLLLLPVVPGSVDFTAAGSVQVGVTIEGASPAWDRRVEWGLARFDDAGLILPVIVITVHSDEAQAACGGNSGRFRPGNPAEVHLCVASPADSGVAQLTTLHELAHAWAETQLTASEQDSFLTLRGLEVWADRRVPRHEWGAEHAAEVVSWGLMDKITPIIRIHDAQPSQLLIAFRELVGGHPRWVSE